MCADSFNKTRVQPLITVSYFKNYYDTKKREVVKWLTTVWNKSILQPLFMLYVLCQTTCMVSPCNQFCHIVPPHSMWGLLYCATCNEYAFGRHKILLGKQCNFLQQDGHFIDILSCSWKLTFCKLINWSVIVSALTLQIGSEMISEWCRDSV